MKRKPSSATIRRARERAVLPAPRSIWPARVTRALENTVKVTADAVTIDLDPLADALRAFTYQESAFFGPFEAEK